MAGSGLTGKHSGRIAREGERGTGTKWCGVHCSFRMTRTAALGSLLAIFGQKHTNSSFWHPFLSSPFFPF